MRSVLSADFSLSTVTPPPSLPAARHGQVDTSSDPQERRTGCEGEGDQADPDLHGVRLFSPLLLFSEQRSLSISVLGAITLDPLFSSRTSMLTRTSHSITALMMVAEIVVGYQLNVMSLVADSYQC